MIINGIISVSLVAQKAQSLVNIIRVQPRQTDDLISMQTALALLSVFGEDLFQLKILNNRKLPNFRP